MSESQHKPVLARCRCCEHEWPLFYLPISVDEAKAFSAKVPCPMCRDLPRDGHEVQAFQTAGWG